MAEEEGERVEGQPAGGPLSDEEFKEINQRFEQYLEENRRLGILGTASCIHDGTWKAERRFLENQERAARRQPHFLITVWNSPPRWSARGVYLGIRRWIWKIRRRGDRSAP